MDFQLSEQQLAFRELIREFAHRSIDPVAHEWELSGRYPAEIVDEMRTIGLFGMLVPERYGGIARHADPLPVLVKTDPAAQPRHRGMSMLLIERETPGLVVGRDLGKLGYKGPESCEVFLNECRVPAENLLGGVEGQGLQQALSALEFGRINIAGRAVGIAQASLDRALAYSHERKAFGHPIEDFQAIQLKLADMATEVQAARLLTWWAASTLDAGKRADMETAMAKLYASEICITAALTCMRIHGGYGYSTDYDIERFYRDAPLMAIGEGTNDILRTVIAKRLRPQGE
jgi:alkylation response protein AidB-like acyl-CoA dehydrogenase